MLNGGSGDFCLQSRAFNGDIKNLSDISWSSNTKNFVVIENENLKIINWIEGNKAETIPLSQIESNSSKFYNYLISKSYKTQNDIVPFVLDIFRQLRNITKEGKNPSEALNILFQLLISIEEDHTNIDYGKWGIEKVDQPNEFNYYVDLIKQGVKSVNPKLDLILRHSAGALFQEAHREVIYFSPQLELFGASNKLAVKNDAYSSIHYTPQYLARTIVENSLKEIDLNKPNLKIFDPSCGSSEFLIEALKQLKNFGFKGKVKIIGWDSSESAINTSKFLLQYEKRTQWYNTDLEFEIKQVDDSLTQQWANDNDLILMNPPFISWELLKSREQRDAVLSTLGSNSKNGKPNQASAFFYKATQSLGNDGVIGCVLPSSIFTFDSYSKMRNEIEEQIHIKTIAKLGNFVFEDALTDVSFFIGKKTNVRIPTKLIWCKNEKGFAQESLRELRKMQANSQFSVEDKNFSIYTPSDFPIIKESWKVISLNEDKFLKDLKRFLSAGRLNHVSEIFHINRGATLGIKNIFKISSHQLENIPKNEHVFFKPVITNNSIAKNKLILSEYVWFPYNKDGLVIKDEDKLNEVSFAKENLIPKKNILQKRTGIKEWWSLTRPRNWQFENEIRLYSNRFGNSNSFAIDITGDCVIEEGNAFLPKKEFEIDDYYFYLACFSSKTFDKLLSIYSKQLAGGNWFDLGKVYVKEIPIPNIYQTEIKESPAYSKLVELAKELEKGNSFVKDVIDDVLKNSFYRF